MKFKENSSMLLGNFDNMKKLVFDADVSELENIFNELNRLLEDYDTDELVEITPNFIRLRKKILNTEMRKKYDARK